MHQKGSSEKKKKERGLWWAKCHNDGDDDKGLWESIARQGPWGGPIMMM